MRHRHQIELERLGLSAVEAQIYLALLRKGGTWRATAVTATMQIPRSTVYLALNSLLDRGLVEAEVGYGGRFSAVRAERALPSLIAAERKELLQRQEELSQRKQVADELAEELRSVATPAAIDVGTEFIQVLRDPRSVAERFDRLQLEAEEQIQVFSKPPIFNRPGNPTEAKVLNRGVQARSIYESAVLDDPGIKPFLAKWVEAGEQARIYDGELPHKLAIFDSKVALMPLIMPGEQMKTVLIRHPQLARSLSLAFEHLWERSEPIASILHKLSAQHGITEPGAQRVSRNGRRDQAGNKKEARKT